MAAIFAVNSITAFSGTLSTNNQGKVFAYWGWNRAAYTNSDISFKGDQYQFKLKNVAAKDRQTPFSASYFNPSKITIPQYNFRIGYFFKPNYSISFGFDHMKYVMQQNQTVIINGTIAGTSSEYDGVYEDEAIRLTEEFLQFEHTDGLNYLNFELRKMDDLPGLSNLGLKNIRFSIFEGVGAGVLFPKSNVVLMNYDRNDQWHVAGYGLNVLAGLNISFFKHFFIQGEVKGGYINMPDILTTGFKTDRARQSFFFLQGNTNFGIMIKL